MGETIINGLGELHLEVIIQKLAAKFGVKVNVTAPIIPYRETIRKKVKAEGRHKKQTGGHGQFGHMDRVRAHRRQRHGFRVCGQGGRRRGCPATSSLRWRRACGRTSSTACWQAAVVGLRCTLYDSAPITGGFLGDGL